MTEKTGMPAKLPKLHAFRTIRQTLEAEGFRHGKDFVMLKNREHGISFPWRLFKDRASKTGEAAFYHAVTKFGVPIGAAQLLLNPNPANNLVGGSILGIMAAFAVVRHFGKKWAKPEEKALEKKALHKMMQGAWLAAQRQAEPEKFTHFVITYYGGHCILLTPGAKERLNQIMPSKPVGELENEPPYPKKPSIPAILRG